MGRIFKRNTHSWKKSKQTEDQRKSENDSSSSSSSSSKINEEVDIRSIKAPASIKRLSINDEVVQNHSSNTWPRLPELALTTSQDSRTYRPVEIAADSPSLSNSSSQVFLGIDNFAHNNMSNDFEQSFPDNNDSESDTEVNVDAGNHRGTEIFFDDTRSSFSLASRLTIDQQKTGFALDDLAASTLVEAALDKKEAKDRHVRFQDHVAESAALVQRMLSVKMGRHHHQDPDPLAAAIQSRHDGRNEEEFELASPRMAMSGGGSVLASLMKLEASRLEGEAIASNKKRSKKDRKKINIKRNSLGKNNRPKSLFNYPAHSDTDPLSESTDHDYLSLLRPKRPPLTKRLSAIASSNYVVPSLEKRKKTAAPSTQRRDSNDSMLTTASQFEPITLEDRIQITFEIANILQKQEFLRKLCRSLMLYGCPAHRLEYAMRQVSRTLRVDAEYIYLPNVMLVTFMDSSTHTTETHFIRQSPTFEMHRLADIYRLEKLVSHGEVSVDEALEFIDKVYNQPPIYPIWSSPCAYALAAFAGCALFYGGRWQEAGVSAALGMIFATNEIFSSYIASFQPIWEITVCILIGFVARGIGKYGLCFTPIAFSSFIIVLPGYPMAVAIIELVSRQLVSGVVRMVYAILYSFLLGYGVSMGSELYLTMDKNSNTVQSDVCKLASSSSTCVSSVSQWYNFFLVPLFALAYCVYLRARLPRWPIMVIVSACTYVINYALACWAHAPSQILQVAPAFGLGLIGNLLAKFTGKLSFDAVLLGVFYLVPSSLGLKAAIGLFGGSDEVGNQGAGFALSMIETSIGITLGLFLATLIVYPKGTQHTPLMSL